MDSKPSLVSLQDEIATLYSDNGALTDTVSNIIGDDWDPLTDPNYDNSIKEIKASLTSIRSNYDTISNTIGTMQGTGYNNESLVNLNNALTELQNTVDGLLGEGETETSIPTLASDIATLDERLDAIDNGTNETISGINETITGISNKLDAVYYLSTLNDNGIIRDKGRWYVAQFPASERGKLKYEYSESLYHYMLRVEPGQEITIYTDNGTCEYVTIGTLFINNDNEITGNPALWGFIQAQSISGVASSVDFTIPDNYTYICLYDDIEHPITGITVDDVDVIFDISNNHYYIQNVYAKKNVVDSALNNIKRLDSENELLLNNSSN